MLKRLQELMNIISARADEHENRKDIRRFLVTGARNIKNALSARKALMGIGQAAQFHETETGSWVRFEDFVSGTRGPFDACDLRHWLKLAEMAGVPFVPAKEILNLSEDEMGLASGTIDLSDSPHFEKMMAGIKSLAEEIANKETVTEEDEMAMLGAETALRGYVDPELLDTKLFEAMDNIPEGWMVRSARVGPSNLKALAGSGLAGDTVPESKFGPDLEIGPGWIRVGNRRKLNVADRRTVEASAQGPVGGTAFLARPWVEAARYMVSDDPHRHGTQFAGKGKWPAEWRAFIEDGKVIGVSFYYSWAGEVSKENAEIALEVWALAQKIADQAVAEQMYPRYLDVEFLRKSPNNTVPEIAKLLAHFGREKVACTLDFIETKDGLKLLEGGPANTPIGGGHPCGFAGCGGLPKFPNKTITEGVAFKNMSHVLIGDPSTWKDGDRTGCILTKQQAEDMVFSNELKR